MQKEASSLLYPTAFDAKKVESSLISQSSIQEIAFRDTVGPETVLHFLEANFIFKRVHPKGEPSLYWINENFLLLLLFEDVKNEGTMSLCFKCGHIQQEGKL